MQPLNKATSRLLDHMTADLADPAGAGESRRKYDAGHGYMAAVVERVGANRYSVAHYFSKNGDLVPDPDLELIKHDGKWYPAACTMATGHYSRALECDGEGRPARYFPRVYRDLRSFGTMMLRNIRAQQGIKVPPAPREDKSAKPENPGLPVEGELIGTVAVGRREFTVERRVPTEERRRLEGDRPHYVLRGKRGACYLTMRNRRNPDLMFLVHGGARFGVALDGVWLTDKNGQLELA